MTRNPFKPDELIGKDVYDAKLKKIGTVSDVTLSLIVGNMSIPVEKIADAGDIIQLKEETTMQTEPRDLRTRIGLS